MKVALRTVVVLLVLSLSLIGMIAKRQYTLNTGTPILLETRPVDPRSLFRGDYVTLRYTIGHLDLDALAGDDSFRRNETVYVLLRAGEAYWQPVSVHHQAPADTAGLVMLKGRVSLVGTHSWNPQSEQMEDRNTIDVRYGIESYFVPEGEGRELERPSADNRIDMRIVVDRFGNAAIQGVLVNGRERYRETLL